MKGFAVTWKGGMLKIGVNEGVSTIHVFEKNGSSHSDIGALDASTNESYTWHNIIASDSNDTIEIELTELKQSSPPDEVMKAEVYPAPQTKLEIFLELEKSLKAKGLL